MSFKTAEIQINKRDRCFTNRVLTGTGRKIRAISGDVLSFC